MDDVAPKDCLVVKVLRSPHAHALIKEIRTDLAEKVDGIVCVLTYKDVPKRRFTMAGQTYPEPSPYDRYILEDRVRFGRRSGCDRCRRDRKSSRYGIKTDQSDL